MRQSRAGVSTDAGSACRTDHALIGPSSDLIVDDGPLALTDSIPASRLEADAYIWLVPITCPFVDFRLKNSLPLEAVFFS